MSQLGTVGQIQPQDLMTSSTTQQAVIGSYAETPDGRGFRYVKAGGTDLVPGKLQQASAEDTTNLQNLSVEAAAIGATSVTTTTTVTLSANQAAGGYLLVTVTPGQGYMYRISSHAAATGAVVTFNLEDPIKVALTTSSKIDVIPNPYDSVVVNPTTATSNPVGVAVYPVGDAEYGWIQTHGPASVLCDGTITVGTFVVASNAVAGAIEPFTGVQAPIGYGITGINTTEYGAVFLTID